MIKKRKHKRRINNSSGDLRYLKVEPDVYLNDKGKEYPATTIKAALKK